MKRVTIVVGCIAIVAGVIVGGCQETPLTGTGSAAEYEGSDFEAERPLMRFRFTGRDSFGVSLRGGLAGVVESQGAGECHTLTGDGKITHLGKTTVSEHTACIDGDEVAGKFTYEGLSDGLLQGSYEGTLSNGTLEADMTIETAEVPAVQEQPTESPAGKGTLTGKLSDTRFQYEVEGWLFHHTREQRIGVVD